MRGVQESRRERPNASRILEEIRKPARIASSLLTPGQRMQMAFALSVDVLRLCRAGLETQGFSESEFDAIMDEKRRWIFGTF